MLEFFIALVSPRRRDEDGASAVEYGLLVAGIAAIIVVAVMALGPVVKAQFTKTCVAVANGATVASTNSSCS